MIIKFVNKFQMTKVLIFCILLIILTGCAVVTPGDGTGADGPGFEEVRVEDDRFPGQFAPDPGAIAGFETGGLTETRCGLIDESQHVERYDGMLGVTTDFVSKHQRPVGLIKWNDNLEDIYDSAGTVSNRKWCSGTLIDENLFLTAGHCFDDRDSGNNILPRINGGGNTSIIPPAEIAQNMHVYFNFQLFPDGSVQTPEEFAITQLEEYRLGNLDFAVVRLEGNPSETFGITSISSTDAEINDMLALIGHPAGQPKKIEAGPAMDFRSTQIRYNDVDTLGGSSGSGILHSDREEIIGVHTNGGCDDASPTQFGGFNYGVRISAILNVSPIISFLAANPPNLPISTNWCENSAISKDECNVLVNIYEDINGPNWITQTNWLETDNPCNWYGVTCDEEQHVTEISLRNNGLKGNIPENLDLLEKLEVLELGDDPKRIDAFHERTDNTNALSGSIPDSIGNLGTLRTLNLSNNLLSSSIPDSLGGLSQLKELYLEQNKLSDPIPDSFNQLTELDVLALNNNQLSGSIPDLSQLDLLTQLRLHNNEFSGSIPGTLGDLDSLQHLYLYDSPTVDKDDDIELRLIGNIPEGLMELKDTLRQLSIHSHKLSGPIPPALGEFESLVTLHLGDNKLTGYIPPELGNLTNLVALSLRNNNLTGGIPSELGKLTKMRNLALGGNDLGGEIPPELGNLKELSGLQLQFAGLTGSVPEEVLELPNWRRPEIAGNRDGFFVHNNPDLLGVIPVEWKDSPNLSVMIQNTQICVPNDDGLQQRFEDEARWITSGITCPE